VSVFGRFGAGDPVAERIEFTARFGYHPVTDVGGCFIIYVYFGALVDVGFFRGFALCGVCVLRRWVTEIVFQLPSPNEVWNTTYDYF